MVIYDFQQKYVIYEEFAQTNYCPIGTNLIRHIFYIEIDPVKKKRNNTAS